MTDLFEQVIYGIWGWCPRHRLRSPLRYTVRIYDYDPENRVVVDYETVILTKLYNWILQTSEQLQFWITSTKKTLGRCQARREQDKFIFICLTKENVFS